ncbi:inorganic phosphate transporter [Numidum massiliense]|uniref:inorganic phosphate transporter n=1 Tax=Numidum massiliense TaxID=1522315 RepID=UPI0006D555B3|nr:inorganic phosphate transporter [Numidum massiliense]
MLFVTIALVIGFFFAMNIGASGTAAAMGAAYGGGAVRKKWLALLLVGVFAILGAVTGGGEVVKTISGGFVPAQLVDVEVTIIILVAACLTLFIANVLGIPLSTSEVTVGAVVGVGVAFKSLYVSHVVLIVAIWLVFPFIAFGMTYLIGKCVPLIEKKIAASEKRRQHQKVLVGFVIAAGCYEAFSAGMNNVANAVGPLVSAGIIDTGTALWSGALFVALGALALGGKVLETNGKKLTKLSLLRACVISLTSGSLVITASLFGIPVPLVQATTMSIIAIGTADRGRSIWQSRTVRQVLKLWIISPAASLVVSYGLVEAVIFSNYYALVAVLCAVIVPFGFVRLKRGSSNGP